MHIKPLAGKLKSELYKKNKLDGLHYFEVGVYEKESLKGYFVGTNVRNSILVQEYEFDSFFYFLKGLYALLHKFAGSKIKFILKEKDSIWLKKRLKSEKRFIFQLENSDYCWPEQNTFEIMFNPETCFDSNTPFKHILNYYLNDYTKPNLEIRKLVQSLSKHADLDILKKNKLKVTKALYQRNMNYFEPISTHGKVLVHLQKHIKNNASSYLNEVKKNKKRINKTLSQLEKFSLRSLDSETLQKSVVYFENLNEIHWFTEVNGFENHHYQSISHYRYYISSLKNTFRKKNVNGVYLLDQNGFAYANVFELDANQFPKNFSTIYDYEIESIRFKRSLLQNLPQTFPREQIESYSKEISKVRRISNESVAKHLSEIFLESNPVTPEEFTSFSEKVNFFFYQKNYFTPQTLEFLIKKENYKDFSVSYDKVTDLFHKFHLEYRKELYPANRKNRNLIKRDILSDTFSEKTFESMICQQILEQIKTNNNPEILEPITKCLVFHKENNLKFRMPEFLYDLVKKNKTYEDFEIVYEFFIRFKEIIKENSENDDFLNIEHYFSYFIQTLLKFSQTTNKKTVILFIEKLISSREKDFNYSTLLHDYSYLTEELIELKKYFNQSTWDLIFLKRSYSYLSQISSQIRMIDSKLGFLKKIPCSLKRELNQKIKNKIDLSTTVERIVEEGEKTYLLNELKITNQDYEVSKNFVKEMNRYNPNIRPIHLFHNFGKETLSLIYGTKEYTFSERNFHSTYDKFARFLESLIKTPLVKKPTKLYTCLNKIKPIADIFRGDMNETEYNHILKELKQRRIEIPDIYKDIDRFHGKFERKGSPEFLIAGDATVCCMSFGRDNAKTYALEKGFGIFNVYYKDRIIANSLVWINKEYNSLILDNIEVHPNYVRFNAQINTIYEKMIEETLKQYALNFAVQGVQYNDLVLESAIFERVRHYIYPLDVKAKRFYTDAEYVYVIPNSKWTLGMIKDVLKKKAVLNKA